LDRCTELLHTLLVSLNNNKDNNSSLVTTALCQQLEGGCEAAPLVLRPYLYPQAGTHSGTRYMGGSVLGIEGLYFNFSWIHIYQHFSTILRAF
jgi:hypothetical protein